MHAPLAVWVAPACAHPWVLCPPQPSPAFVALHRHSQVVVDMDRLEEQAGSAFTGADSVFCCLGTTRAVRALGHEHCLAAGCAGAQGCSLLAPRAQQMLVA